MFRPTALRTLASTSRQQVNVASVAARTFSSSSTAAFAQPTEGAPSAGKAPQMKEFKIYRWVSARSINAMVEDAKRMAVGES